MYKVTGQDQIIKAFVGRLSLSRSLKLKLWILKLKGKLRAHSVFVFMLSGHMMIILEKSKYNIYMLKLSYLDAF